MDQTTLSNIHYYISHHVLNVIMYFSLLEHTYGSLVTRDNLILNRQSLSAHKLQGHFVPDTIVDFAQVDISVNYKNKKNAWH